MTEERSPLGDTDGKPASAQQREYWSSRRVYASLSAVSVVAAVVPLATLPRVLVAIPVIHNVDDWDEHLDWSSLFVSQNVVGSVLVLALLFGMWTPFMLRSTLALKVVGSGMVFGWLCAGAFFASATNQRIGDIVSALVTWPLVSFGLGCPAFFFALAVAVPGIYVGIAIESRTALPQPLSAPHPPGTPPGYARSTVAVPPTKP